MKLNEEAVDQDNDLEFVFNNQESEDDDEEEDDPEDSEPEAPSQPSKKKKTSSGRLGKRQARRVELEFEDEVEDEPIQEDFLTTQ